MSTPVCEMLGIEQPIVQAPMAALRNSTARAWEAAGRPQTTSGQDKAT